MSIIGKISLLVIVMAFGAITIMYTDAAYAQGANVDSITFVKETNVTDAIRDMQNGELDVYYRNVPPSTIDALESTKGLHLYESTGGIRYSIFVNPADTEFNPFSDREIRFALNYIIDRDYILNDLLGGHGSIQYSNLGPTHRDYNSVSDAQNALGIVYNQDKADQIITKVLEAKGASKNNDGIWQYEGADVVIKMFIRQDDSIRKSLGERIATELESIGFVVEKRYGNLVDVYSAVYGTDPKDYTWHIYTEAWLGQQVSKYDTSSQAGFYAPWKANMPGSGIASYWNYQNDTIDNITQEIYNESFTDEAQRIKLVQRADQIAISEAVRIFLASQNELHIASENVSGIVTTQGEGISSRFSTINAHVEGKPTLNIGVRHISQGAWNPIGGFSDTYSNTIWDVLHDPSIDRHPVTGDIIQVRTNLMVDTHGPDASTQVPDDTIHWNHTSKTWETVETQTTYVSKVTVDMTFSNWHNGQPMNINDIMYGVYFSTQWGQSEPGDDTYDQIYSPAAKRSLELKEVSGIRVLDDNTIEVYLNYWHQDDSEIAANGIYWSVMPWEIYAAIEKTIINDQATFSTQNNTQIPWLSLVNSTHAGFIKEHLEKFKSGEYDTPEGLYNQELDVQPRYDASIGWINTHNHAVISNGPFYLSESYAKDQQSLTIKAFEDDTYPFGPDKWEYIIAESSPLGQTIKIGSIVPLTGGASGYGMDMAHAIDLAINDFNEKNTIQLELTRHSDSATNPVTTQKAFNDTYSSGIRLYIGPSISADAVINDLRATNSIFMICCLATTPEAIDDNIFRLIANHTGHGNALAHLMKSEYTDTVIIVGRNNPWITDLMDQTATKFEGLGGTVHEQRILYDDTYDSAITELQTELNTIAADCTACNIAILYIGFEETVGFMESLHDDLRIPENIPLSMYGAETNTVIPKIVENQKAHDFGKRLAMKSVQPIAYENDINIHVKSYVKQKLDRDPSIYAYSAYDAVMLLGDSLINANSTNVSVLKESIKTTGVNYNGALGNITLDAAGDVENMAYGVWELQDSWINTLYFDYNTASFVITPDTIQQANKISTTLAEPVTPPVQPQPPVEPEPPVQPETPVEPAQPQPPVEPESAPSRSGSGGGGFTLGPVAAAYNNCGTSDNFVIIGATYGDNMLASISYGDTTIPGKDISSEVDFSKYISKRIPVNVYAFSFENVSMDASLKVNIYDKSGKLATVPLSTESCQDVHQFGMIKGITAGESLADIVSVDKTDSPAPEETAKSAETRESKDTVETKPVEPIETDKDEKQSESAQPVEPTEMAEPVEPVEPTDNAPITEPVEPVAVANDSDNGCLIATAAYGTELAPQVQQLREIRDSIVLPTQAGTSFMSAFNNAYYTFSPQIADLQREHVVFRESVKIFITPGITILGVMHSSDGSEESILFYGSIAIAMLAGIYIVAPTFAIRTICKKF